MRTEVASEPATIHLVSPLGGMERRLLDFPTDREGKLSWSPDGRWLAAARARAKDEETPESSGIHLIPIGGGEPRVLTLAEPPGFDAAPAFSTDGHSLAYASCRGATGSPTCDIHVLPLDPDVRPRGAPRLVARRTSIQGMAWTRDGRSVLYGSPTSQRLMRVSADGSSPAEPVELAGRGAYDPTAARSRDRIALQRLHGVRGPGGRLRQEDRLSGRSPARRSWPIS